MYFSLQESGELLQGQDAPASGLYFDCDKLPADWYAQLQAALAGDTVLKAEDITVRPENPALKPEVTAFKPGVTVLKAEEQKKATVASKSKPAPSD